MSRFRSHIGTSVSAFMQDLFREGALGEHAEGRDTS